MSIQWSQLTFRALEDTWRKSEADACNELDRPLIYRYEAIMCIVKSDRFWPPATGAKRVFVPVLCEVLARLPEKEFAFIESQIGFVLEDPILDALAVNVPVPDVADFGRPEGANETAAMIVFFRSSWKFSTKALAGLIAHELAHSFVSGQGYTQDETFTNDKVRSWGFEQELICLDDEKGLLRKGQLFRTP